MPFHSSFKIYSFIASTSHFGIRSETRIFSEGIVLIIQLSQFKFVHTLKCDILILILVPFNRQ